MITRRWRRAAALTVILCSRRAADALDGAAAKQLGDEDGDAKLEAINKLIAAGDIAAIPIFKAMQEEALQR